MTLKSDEKFKNTFRFKYDVKDLVNCHYSTKRSEKLYFDGIFYIQSI